MDSGEAGVEEASWKVSGPEGGKNPISMCNDYTTVTTKVHLH